MIKSQRRERVIRAVILALVLPFFTAIVGPGAQTAYAADSCTGPRIIGVQYSMNHLDTPEANLEWKRGTNTAIFEFLPTMLEWKRGTRTALTISEMADVAYRDFKEANPTLAAPIIEKFDDRFDTKTAVNKAREWTANPCFLALIGPSQSFIAEAIIPIYSDAGVPILSPSASDPRLNTVLPSTFHRLVLSEDPHDFRSLNTLKALGITKPAIFEDDEQEESLLSRWADSPGYPLYSLLEWKRGTPTVTTRGAMIADAKAKGANGYFFNGLSSYPENISWDMAGFSWPLVGEFSEVCPKCSGLVFGEKMDAAYIDEKYFENTGVEGARILATSVPLWKNSIVTDNRPSPWSELSLEGPYSTPTYDAMRFALEAIKAGNTTAQNVNTFINTKKYNGVSGPISFDSKGELVGRSQIVMTVTNGKRIITGGLPANYVANGAISNNTAVAPTTIRVGLKIKDFNESAAASLVDFYNGSLVRRHVVSEAGFLSIQVPNGTSLISLTPYDDSEIGIRRERFEIVVTNGAVTSFKNLRTSTAVTFSNSSFQVRLAPPTAIGTINSSVSYAGKYYQFETQKTAAANRFTYINGKVRSDNKIYITTVSKFGARGSIWAYQAEDWRHRGASSQSFTAAQLTGTQLNFPIDLPPAKITGQVSGTFGAGSYAQLTGIFKNYSTRLNQIKLSSDGHFGFAPWDGKGIETFTVRVYSRDAYGVRAFGESAVFTYKQDETKTVSNLTVALPANNVTGSVTLEGIGVPNAQFQVSKTGAYNGALFRGSTDLNGQFNLGLAPDTYTFTFNGGYMTPYESTAITCVVRSGTNTCNATLTPPKIIGKITGIPDLGGGQIELWREYSPGQWAKPNYAYVNSSGDFYGFVSPGTYLMRVFVKSKSAAYSVTAGKCIAPSNGKVTCNIAFGAGITFKVLTSTGAPYSGSLGMVLTNLDTSTQMAGQRTTIKYNATTGFTYPLLPGRYSLTIDPYRSEVAAGGAAEFRFEYKENTITSVTPMDSQSVITPNLGVFSLMFTRPQFEARLRTYSGDTVTAAANIWLRDSSGNTRQLGMTTNNGSYTYSLAERLSNGIYTIWTTPGKIYNSVSGYESRRETFTIVNGFAPQIIEIRENAPNVSGTLSGPSGPLAGVRLNFYSYEMKKYGYFYAIQAVTDSAGKYFVFLPQGEIQISASGGFDAGVVDLTSKCQVADTATVCNLEMKAPNTIAKITVAGKVYSFGSVSFKKANNKYEEISALEYWGEEGTFAASLNPGRYIPYARIYYRDAGGTQALTYAIGEECVVPESGTVNCATDFAKVNLQYSVLDYRGDAPISVGINHTVELITDTRDESKNPIFYGANSKNSDKNYIGFLSDGSYRLTIQPNGKDSNIGNIERYLFDVTNGAVLNMRVDGSTQIVDAVKGAYQLKLKSPAISGRVVATDGTTGISYTEVRAELNGVEYFDETDSNGYFSFDLGSTVVDGTYLVSARSPYNNVTLGESAKVNVVVAGGVGTAVTISLRTPNLVGTVSGPKGVSKNNWITVYRLYPNGRSEYLRWGQQSTNSAGSFGFRMEPGDYSISTNDDMANAGGTAVRNYKCTVPETGTASCDISLIAPNIRGTFTKAGVNLGGTIYIQRKTSLGTYESFNKYTHDYGNGWYMSLEPGTYRAVADYWEKNFQYYSKDFTIVDSSTVDVAIEVPPVNLRIQVTSASGITQLSPNDQEISYVHVVRYDGGNGSGLGWVNNYRKQAGLMELSLSDGKYSLSVYSENKQLGVRKEFSFEVESGTVSLLTSATNAETVSAVNGIYQLQLGQPSISGTVVSSNGVTPVPSASVGYFDETGVCPWCERGWTYTGANGYFGFGEIPDGQYQIYAHPNSGDITKGKSSLTSVTINGGQPQNGLVLALRDANVTGTIQGLTGNFNVAYVDVRKSDEYGNRYSPIGVYNLQANSQGNYGLYLEPGKYRFIARIYSKDWSNVTSGFSQDCIVPDTGSITCDVTLNTSNISMRVVVPGSQTPLPNVGIGIYAGQNDGNLATSNPQVSENNSGIFTAFLENATWRVYVDAPSNSSEYSHAYYNVYVENGVVVSVENDLGETLTAVNGAYSLSPKLANLRGNVTFNGIAFNSQAYVRVQTDMNGWWSEVASRWTYGGNFGFNVAPGTYRIVVDPYGAGGDQAPVITTVYDCVVASSGVATCNVALSAGNLSGRIVDENGQLYRQAYINLHQVKENGKWEYLQVSVNNGVFKSNLPNGKYQITVVPYWEVRGNYTENNYEILVTNNVISSVKNLRTNETITALNGSYDFVLGLPAIRGRVLATGTSTQGIQDIEIRVGTNPSIGNWQYGTRSATNGNFALTVPDGTYVIQAVPNGSKTRYGKSETQTVTVINGAIATSITLRLREPNFFGRVVTPGASPLPVSNVNVNIYIDGEYFYSYTGSDGVFAAYVDKANPDCPNKCSLNLGYYQSTEFSSKNYAINSIGNIGDKALGGVSTRVQVRAPATGSATTANRYGYVAIEQWSVARSQYEWMPGYQTNQLGIAGLSLDVGEKYRLTAYPGEGNYALFSPKVFEVESFSAIDSPTITIIFDRPNISLLVRNIAGARNMWGWYQVSKYNGGNGKYEYFKDGYLDDQGRGALVLPQGDYSVHFWPGKISAGVEKEILLSVDSASVVTGTSVLNGVATVVLPNGNVSGFVRNQSAVGLGSVVITAVRDNDPTKMVSTVSGANGYYELNLDRSYAWTIKAIEPISVSNGQYALSTDSPSNAATSSADITITINP